MWTFELSAAQTLMTRLDVTTRSHDIGERHDIGGGVTSANGANSGTA